MKHLAVQGQTLIVGRFYSQLKKQECNSREIIKLVTGVMVGKECGNKNV
jgi:hypothetical protein